jgi:hypothetical protein
MPLPVSWFRFGETKDFDEAFIPREALHDSDTCAVRIAREVEHAFRLNVFRQRLQFSDFSFIDSGG